jgi:hypothetical protein
MGSAAKTAYRQLPVWPLYLLAGLVALPGGWMLLNHYDKSVPEQDTLTHFSGTVDTVREVNDVSGSSIGVGTPFDSIHFTLSEQPEVFVFSSALPERGTIYRRLAFDVDVWVSERIKDSEQPLMVYRLEQHVPQSSSAEAINISYERIAAVLEANHRSYERLGAVLMVVAAAFFVVAKLADIWNRHRHEFTA